MYKPNYSSDDNTSTAESATNHPPPQPLRPPPPPPARNVLPRPPMAFRSQAPNAQPRPMAFRSQAPSAQLCPKKIGPNWLPSPYMTLDLVPYQLTPVRALAPEYSQTDTTNLAVPKLYAARIVQLKDELRLEDEGEAVKWLLKQSEPAIITATGTGTMPIMRSSSAGHSNGGGGPLVMSAPLAGNPFANHGLESSSGDIYSECEIMRKDYI